MKDRETKVSKGAAFVRFKTLPAAQAAIEGLNGQTSMDERLGPLSVSFASGESSRLGLDEGVLNAPEGQTKLFIGARKLCSTYFMSETFEIILKFKFKVTFYLNMVEK